MMQTRGYNIMMKITPWAIGLLVFSIVGFVIADLWGVESQSGYATVTQHRYNEEYSTYDYETMTTTYYDEEFILIYKYENNVTSDHVRERTYHNYDDGDKAKIAFKIGKFSDNFYASIVE